VICKSFDASISGPTRLLLLYGVFLEDVLRGLVKLRPNLFGLQYPSGQAICHHADPRGFLRPAIDKIEEKGALSIVPAHRSDRSSVEHVRINRVDQRFKLRHRFGEYPGLNLKVRAVGKLRQTLFL